jgi:phosphatidylglycerol:prolipoprotein diacylglycerol transferase
VLQTLFHIPAPIVLFAWGVFAIGLLVFLVWRKGLKPDTYTHVTWLGLVTVAIWFVLPRLVEKGIAADGSEIELGIPIRGYGTMVLVGVGAGLALAIDRARRVGVDPDLIYSLTFWMFLGAIVGARTFYVVQKWDQFASGNWYDVLGAVLKITEGGLVIYGALAGALAAGAVFVWRRNVPALALGDLIAPSLALGLSIGRLGCLLNGCCYGGTSDVFWSITFPQKSSRYSRYESPPYWHQHSQGLLHGISVAADQDNHVVIQEILDKSGPPARAGLRAGDRIQSINGRTVNSLAEAQNVLEEATATLEITLSDNRTIRWSIGSLPRRSRPVHPTQIYSSINAAALFFFLWAYYPFRRRDGEVFALLLTIYPMTRFLLEIIRQDEPAVFATGMTISQNISLLMLAGVAGLWIYILRQPPFGPHALASGGTAQ